MESTGTRLGNFIPIGIYSVVNPIETNCFYSPAMTPTAPSALQIRCPARKSPSSIQRNYFALTPEQENSKAFEVIRTYAHWSSRQAIGKALLVSLCHLEPAPGQLDELADWYLNALNHLVEDDRNEFERIRKHPGKDFWLVFQAKISNGNTSFAIRLVITRRLNCRTARLNVKD